MAEDLGTHSFRKGSTTYTTSGSADGPSFNAVCQRAGWKLGTVQDKYLRWERASDNYAGRVVCGLPLDSDQFAILPPHFETSAPPPSQQQQGGGDEWDPSMAESKISSALHLCYSADLLDVPHLLPVLRMCLASAVYHMEHLLHKLHPRGSSLLQHPLFCNSSLQDGLRVLVRCGRRSSVMAATGIPAHVVHIGRLKDIEESIRENNEKMERSTNRIITEVLQGVDKIFDEKSFEQGNITSATLREQVTGGRGDWGGGGGGGVYW